MLRYALVWPRHLFDDWWMPAGYPFALQLLRAITNQVALITILQHLAGLGIGLIGYALARRVNAPRLAAIAVALPAFLSGDLIFIEHSLATETLFTLLMTGGFLAATIGLARRSMGAFVLASCLLGASCLVRNIGQIVLPAVAAGILISWWRSPALLARALLATLLPAVAILVTYVAAAKLAHGYAGLTDMGGWNIYGRVATFADCSRFEPPKGSEGLCETLPASERPGTFYYGNSPKAPAGKFDLPNALFGFYRLDPRKNELVRQFAVRAITHQPLDYARAVAFDAARYVAPSIDRRPMAGPGPSWYDFRSANLWDSDDWLEHMLTNRYRDARIRWRSSLLAALGGYASIVRFNGVVVLLALGASVAGLTLTKDRLGRAVLVMLVAAALALYLLPVIMSSYDYRYGFPAQVPLGWAAVLGTWLAVVRLRVKRVASPNVITAEQRE
jgi:hypothetical protein